LEELLVKVFSGGEGWGWKGMRGKKNSKCREDKLIFGGEK